MLGGACGKQEGKALEETKMPTSPKRLARIAGVLYLGVAITGGFAEGFVEPRMYVAGNAAATAGNVVANSGLVRLAVADLLVMCATYGWSYDDRKTRPRLPTTETQTA